MLREPAEPTASEPKQSGSFRYLQGMLEAGEGGKTPNTLPPLPPLPLPCPVYPSPSNTTQSTPSSHPPPLQIPLCLTVTVLSPSRFPLHHPRDSPLPHTNQELVL